MSRKNSDVIKLWKNGEKCKNGRGSLWTDGKWLYSYRLAIGYRTTNGICILGNYTASSGYYRSNTTSCHIGRARKVVNSDLFWHPAVFEASKEAFDRDITTKA